jgi:hypothetical protein
MSGETDILAEDALGTAPAEPGAMMRSKLLTGSMISMGQTFHGGISFDYVTRIEGESGRACILTR